MKTEFDPIQFSHAVPTAYLERFDEQSSCYLILAQQALKDEKYRNFFKKSNKMKILDNGAYELGHSIDTANLVKLAEEVDANYIVCPDVFLDHEETLKLTKKFVEKDIPNKIKLIGVPQGITAYTYLGCAKALSEIERIQILGVSFLVTTKCFGHNFDIASEKVESIRPYVVKFLEEIKPNWRFHLLGCGNPIEMMMYKDDPGIMSCDSSVAYKFGKQGFHITEFGAPRNVYEKLNMEETPLSQVTAGIVEKNMNQINKFCHFKTGILL